jgi:hypothetical protein
MSDPTLRFAAGSAARPSSGVWRLWVRGSDVYLGARVALQWFKLSMHQSGQWISAFTSQSGIVDEIGLRRRHAIWNRPPEFTPGWTQGPSVVIPWVKWSGELRPMMERPTADTLWMPGPSHKKKLSFNILYSSPKVPSGEIESVSQPGDAILGSLPLSNGEKVWVQAHQQLMTLEERRGIDRVQREFPGFKLTRGTHRDVDAWGLWIPKKGSVEGIPLLVQFRLGRHHFERGDAGDRA